MEISSPVPYPMLDSKRVKASLGRSMDIVCVGGGGVGGGGKEDVCVCV